MSDTTFNKMQVIKYMIWTFGIAYIIQVVVAQFYNNIGNSQIGQLILALMMFIPLLGVIFSGVKLKDMGWKPQIKKNIKSILIAWFSPAILSILGACLYFLIFPKHFDMSGNYMTVATGSSEVLKQMEEQGISYSMYVIISIIASVTYGPLINAVFALGEEVGWRGFLYPQLKAKFGRRIGWILGGIIWGAWHWPLIWLIGYEYGSATCNNAGYIGFPVMGMLLFCVITVGLGILHDWLYEKSGSIWVPAIFHGAFNAAAAIPLMICIVNTGSARLLGPAPAGIVSSLPFLIFSIIILFNKKTVSDKPNKSEDLKS